MTPSFVCFKWQPAKGYRSQFGPETVNTLRAMIARHYPLERFICVTDDSAGIESGVEIVPLWNDFADLPSPHGGKNPSCYRRLKAYSSESVQWFGPRFAIIDLDCVVTGDLRPVFDRPEEFVIWGDTHPSTYYNGGLTLMTAGCRTQVWDTFDPLKSPEKSKRAGQYGSDQGWISYCLGPNEAKWTKQDGIYSYRNHFRNQRPNCPLPENAKIVMFHGAVDPWDQTGQSLSWVRQNYVGAREVAA